MCICMPACYVSPPLLNNHLVNFLTIGNWNWPCLLFVKSALLITISTVRRGSGSKIQLSASSDLLLIWRKPLLFSKVVIEEHKDVVLTVSTSVSSDSHLFGKTRVLFYLPKCSHLLALFTFSRLFRRDYFLFSSLILDRVLSSVFFTCRKYKVGQTSQQGKLPDMAEGN